MTVIIGGFHVSLLLIACGTNSELSCSAISGLRRLLRSLSLSLRLESIDGFLTTVGNTRRRPCRGLFRDHGSSFNFREEQGELRSPATSLCEVGEDSKNIGNTIRNAQTYNRDFKSSVARSILYIPLLYSKQAYNKHILFVNYFRKRITA